MFLSLKIVNLVVFVLLVSCVLSVVKSVGLIRYSLLARQVSV